jgi:hypothetical protein
MQEPTIEEIRDFLIAQLKDSIEPEVTGPTLGGSVKLRYPSLDLRSGYGGLLRFVKDYCGDVIVYTTAEGTGGDVLYRHKDRAPTRDRAAMAWTAFTNPNVKQELALGMNGELLLHSASSPAEGTVLGKITTEQYRDMCRSFLESVSPEQKDHLEPTLTRDNFWPIWSQALRDTSDPGLLSRWSAWRLSEIERIFMNIASEREIDTQVAGTAWVSLFNSRTVKKTGTSIRAVGLPYRTSANSSTSDYIELLHAVVDVLSTDDLRKLWVPLGAVIDALRKGHA